MVAKVQRLLNKTSAKKWIENPIFREIVSLKTVDYFVVILTLQAELSSTEFCLCILGAERLDVGFGCSRSIFFDGGGKGADLLIPFRLIPVGIAGAGRDGTGR